MAELEVNDIQGIVLRTYGSRRSARYLFLTITEVDKTRQWIGKISKRITVAKFPTDEERSKDQDIEYLNLAISHSGMKKLKVPVDEESYNGSYRLGPLHPHTLRMLGDSSLNGPENWKWGGTDDSQDEIHILLMVYTKTDEDLERFCSELESEYSQYGLRTINSFDTQLQNDNKEHFGYVDGISQPIVKGAEGKQKQKYSEYDNTVESGEFVLGYLNEYQRYPLSPLIKMEEDKSEILEKSREDESMKDLGKNGSYIVFRQLHEDVKGFWDKIVDYLEDHRYGPVSKGAEYVGAKMFGRWTNGSPIAKHPESPGPGMDNDFTYYDNDKLGHKCPIGSHARRANPRDEFEHFKPKKDKENSLSFSKKHRIIRRARPYGKPVAESMKLEDILKAPHDNEERGIYFIVVNADYGRQFEFIQQTWMASPEFRDLYSDPDPLMGSQENEQEGNTNYFTIQGDPVRQRVPDMKSYVLTKGSAYFFMPGIKALEYISRGY